MTFVSISTVSYHWSFPLKCGLKTTDEEMAFRRCIIDKRNQGLTAAIHWHLMATSLTVLSGNVAAIFMYFMIPGSFAYLKISSAMAPKYKIRNEIMKK
jgi:hypothetical protein